MAKRKPILEKGYTRLRWMTTEELQGAILTLANYIAEVDAACNRHALSGEPHLVSRCGCCGESMPAHEHHRYSPHREGCPIKAALDYCRDGFKEQP